MISQKRLEENLTVLSKISAEGQGITRLAFSEHEGQAFDFIAGKMKEAGLKVRADNFGNIIGRRDGLYNDAAVVMMGSHLDSVPNGGNFDGVVGVLTALEVISVMNEQGFQNEQPIELVVFRAEESSRFGVATLGSKVMCGQIKADDLRTITDKSKRSLYDVLKENGFDADNIENAVYQDKVKLFLEVHIEQGKVLEATGKQIGVVTGIAAPTRLRVFLDGHADHSGATPMGMRHDALCAAAEMVLAVESLGGKTVNPCVATVGILEVSPCVMNVIPGKVELGIDIRSIYDNDKSELTQKIKEAVKEIAQARGIECEIKEISDERPVPLRENVLEFLQKACLKNGVEHILVPSGAGHDAMHWAAVYPVGMLFIPCREGISHHHQELAKIEDIACSAKILYDIVAEASGRETEI